MEQGDENGGGGNYLQSVTRALDDLVPKVDGEMLAVVARVDFFTRLNNGHGVLSSNRIDIPPTVHFFVGWACMPGGPCGTPTAKKKKTRKRKPMPPFSSCDDLPRPLPEALRA